MGSKSKPKVALAKRVIDTLAPSRGFFYLPLEEKIKVLGKTYSLSIPNEVTADSLIDFATRLILARQKHCPYWGTKKLRKLTNHRKKGILRKKPYETNNRESEINEFYKSWEWKRLRYDFLTGKKRTCECCGVKAGNGISIHVDHIKPIRHYWELRLDKNNLQILCEDCNMGKGSRDETNWTEENVVSLSLVREQLKIRE